MVIPKTRNATGTGTSDPKARNGTDTKWKRKIAMVSVERLVSVEELISEEGEPLRSASLRFGVETEYRHMLLF